MKGEGKEGAGTRREGREGGRVARGSSASQDVGNKFSLEAPAGTPACSSGGQFCARSSKETV